MKKMIYQQAILASLALMAVPSWAAFMPIAVCPFVISAPGDYQLIADLSCGGGDGITITASNVSLKLNGHTITAANGSKNAIVVGGTTRVDHVTVAGPGLIQNQGGANAFSNAIFLTNADYAQVSQVSIIGVLTNGIEADNCTFLTVGSNAVGPSRTISTGILIRNSSSSAVFRNDTSGGNIGIEVEGPGGGNTVNNNVANGNSLSGIAINSPSKVFANTTNGNANGIFAAGPGVVITNNTAVANTTVDLSDLDGNCAGDLWGDNVFNTTFRPCIH